MWSIGCIVHEMCTGEVPVEISSSLPKDEDFHYQIVSSAFQMCTENNPASRVSAKQLLDFLKVTELKDIQEKLKQLFQSVQGYSEEQIKIKYEQLLIRENYLLKEIQKLEAEIAREKKSRKEMEELVAKMKERQENLKKQSRSESDSPKIQEFFKKLLKRKDLVPLGSKEATEVSLSTELR